MVTVGAASVVKLQVKLLTIWSGGSMASASVTSVATTVPLQVAPSGRLTLGVSVMVLVLLAGRPLLKVTGAPQFNVTPPAATLTGSLKFTVIVVLVARLLAPLPGSTELTLGAESTVKVDTKLAAILSGGSIRSLSVILAASTVRVQVAPVGSGGA